ncbi:MAG: hypothetical protein KAV87_49715, partial [Desulfobacteraceae bacterium]|nr:hypothetical protein [Desulfobacteraceae bacterium]
MQLSTVLTVMGILVSLLFGAWGVYLALKKRYPGHATFLQETALPLFDTIVKNLPELKVSFRDKPVGEGLVLLKGAILNTGSKDISPDMVAEPITMALPEGHKWITVKLVAHSPKVNCTVTADEHSLVFNIGLFRCAEYLRFEALAEVPINEKEEQTATADIGEKMLEVIRTTHRIADTQRVVTAELLPATRGIRRLKRFAVLLGVMVVTLAVVFTAYWIKGWPADMRFTVPTDSGDIAVEAQYTVDGTVTLKGVDSKDYKRELPVAGLLQIEGLKPYVAPKSDTKVAFIVLGFYTLLPLLLCIGAYKEQRKAKRLRKLLSRKKSKKRLHRDREEP